MGMPTVYVKALQKTKLTKIREDLADKESIGGSVYGFWASPEARELRAQLNKAGI
jgi:hypothetical protein